MNKVRFVRKRLGLSQEDLAARIGKSQGVISNVEVGRQDLMPSDARSIISLGREIGVQITFDDIYDAPALGDERGCSSGEAQKAA